MKFSFVTLFPEIIHSYFSVGILSRAVQRDELQYATFNPRDYTKLAHKQVDDRPFGGGAGMLLRADVLKDTLVAIQDYERATIIVTAANGKQYTQKEARKLSLHEHIIIVAGRYEGIDQRFIDGYADEVYSVGSYVLSGGELPSLVIADSIIRLFPGVLGNESSLTHESYESEDDVLEYPQYTRPAVFEGMSVPEPLVSGNHQLIQQWNKAHTKKLLVDDSVR